MAMTALQRGPELSSGSAALYRMRSEQSIFTALNWAPALKATALTRGLTGSSSGSPARTATLFLCGLELSCCFQFSLLICVGMVGRAAPKGIAYGSCFRVR